MGEADRRASRGASIRRRAGVLIALMMLGAACRPAPVLPPPRIPHAGLACVAWEDTRTALDKLGGQYPYRLSTIRLVERHAFLTIRFSHQARGDHRLALAGHSVLAVTRTLSRNPSALSPDPARLDQDRRVAWANRHCRA